jgi:hypothetical protein
VKELAAEIDRLTVDQKSPLLAALSSTFLMTHPYLPLILGDAWKR